MSCLHVSADGKAAWTGDGGNKLIDVDKGTSDTLSCDDYGTACVWPTARRRGRAMAASS